MGSYLYLPFAVPPGTGRIDVAITKSGGDAKTGVGIFDERGAAYQQNGFRGIYGEERAAFFVATDTASQSFLPGPINPGTWTVIVPVFTMTVPTIVTATVTLTPGGGAGVHPAALFGPEPGVVVDAPGWYRGDLHCHTPESSDAWNSKSAMSPREWGDAARAIGLDFAAMTDHNVVTQNIGLADAAGSDVLLMPGEEMTNWFHGHATVSGFEIDDWLDWRQVPGGLPLTTGTARIQDFMRAAKETGAYVAAAHPLGAHLSWQFFADGEADSLARPHGLEIWTGPFQPDDEAALKKWDETLLAGWKVWANGGTDLHGVKNTNGFNAGTPTTIVYADRLSKPAIVEALKKGRSFVTRRPDGVELYLTAKGPAGQAEVVGGTIHGEPGDVAAVEVLVRRAGGMRLLMIRDGVPISVTTITADEQVVKADLPIGAGGFVRVEVRDRIELDPTNPIAGRTDMEAFTNPILLAVGEPPPGYRPTFAPPGPPGPRRPAGGGQGAPTTTVVAPGEGEAPPSGEHPPTGGAGGATVAAVAGAAGLAGVAGVALARMTNTEAILRAGTGGDGLAGRSVVLTGQLTDARVLTRWTPDCCTSHERPVDVEVVGLDPNVAAGDWLEVEGRWVEGTGAGFGGRPAFEALSVRRLDDPPPRLEA